MWQTQDVDRNKSWRAGGTSIPMGRCTTSIRCTCELARLEGTACVLCTHMPMRIRSYSDITQARCTDVASRTEKHTNRQPFEA